MKNEFTKPPLPFTTNVMINTAGKGVSLITEPTAIFRSAPPAIPPGTVLLAEDLEGQEIGVCITVQKGSAINVILLLMEDQPDALIESLCRCIISGDPEPQKRSIALLKRIEAGMKTGFERPAQMPGMITGVTYGGTDGEEAEDQ